MEEYPFVEGRGIHSLLCVPLITKAKKFGLVLIEHKYFNAFDDNNLRLLNIIGQQVGIAMENVELYQRMHEMATIDSLTGIYNRLYFQESSERNLRTPKRKIMICRWLLWTSTTSNVLTIPLAICSVTKF